MSQRIRFFINITAIFFLLAAPPFSAAVGKTPFVRHEIKQSENTLNLASPLSKCWEFDFGKRIPTDRIIASDNLSNSIYTTDGEKLESFDTLLVKSIWASDLEAPINSNITLDAESLYFTVRTKSVTGTSYNKLKSVSRTSGLTNWQIRLPGGGAVPGTVKDQNKGDIYLTVENNNIILLESIDGSGTVYVLKKNDGSLSSTRQIGVADSSLVFTFARAKTAAAVDGSKTKIGITADTDIGGLPTGIATVTSLSVTNDGAVIYGDKKGFVYRMPTPGSPRIWKYRTGAAITGIVLTVYGALVASNDNFIYLLDPVNGKLIWKKRMSGRIVDNPFIYSNYAVIGNLSQPAVDVVDLRNGKVVNRLFLDNENYPASQILFSNDLLIIATWRGLSAFSAKNCR